MKLSNLDYMSVDTGIGEFIVAARDEAIKGGWFRDQKYFPDINTANGWRNHETPVLRAACEQLKAYFSGELTAFTLPLAPDGTPFQQAVWHALEDVPWGSTTTYGSLARRIDHPKAFHAVGNAVGRNPISIIIPCHRALGSNGSLTGYAGGLERKRWLLDHESAEGRLFA